MSDKDLATKSQRLGRQALRGPEQVAADEKGADLAAMKAQQDPGGDYKLGPESHPKKKKINKHVKGYRDALAAVTAQGYAPSAASTGSHKDRVRYINGVLKAYNLKPRSYNQMIKMLSGIPRHEKKKAATPDKATAQTVGGSLPPQARQRQGR